MITPEFLITSLVVVLMPGAGVLYTVATGLVVSRRASLFAAIGCTLGIIPSLLASVLGLAAVFHTSAVAFQIVKYVGAAYLIYLAWTMWRSSSALSLNKHNSSQPFPTIAFKGFLLNILNPKLSIFFLAFLPQFVTPNVEHPLTDMLSLGLVFMLMTLVVFIAYGFMANSFSELILRSKRVSLCIQKLFAGSFAVLGLKLAFSERT
jgi:threonine/homoserine/homoserine lactone efflux protein